MAYSDSNGSLICTFWNGSSWDHSRMTILESSALTDLTLKGWDIEYEMLSGDLLAAWGQGSVTGITYATLKAGESTWSSNFNLELDSASPDSDDFVELLDLVADPGSSRILLTTRCEPSDDFEVGIWTGSGWTSYTQIDDSWQPFRWTNEHRFWMGRPIWKSHCPMGRWRERGLAHLDPIRWVGDGGRPLHWGPQLQDLHATLHLPR